MDSKADYSQAVKTIKEAILSSQSRAVQMISGTQLSLYFGRAVNTVKTELVDFKRIKRVFRYFGAYNSVSFYKREVTNSF